MRYRDRLGRRALSIGWRRCLRWDTCLWRAGSFTWLSDFSEAIECVQRSLEERSHTRAIPMSTRHSMSFDAALDFKVLCPHLSLLRTLRNRV